jgi:hypothetical protein
VHDSPTGGCLPRNQESSPVYARTLNFVTNRFFARVFSSLMIRRCSKIEANRAYLGELDPFGYLDLIIGTARQNLKIVEIPIHYGAAQIYRFADGFMLLRMMLSAFWKLKAI